MHCVTNFESRLNAGGTYRHRFTLGIKYLYMNKIYLAFLIVQETGSITQNKTEVSKFPTTP